MCRVPVLVRTIAGLLVGNVGLTAVDRVVHKSTKYKSRHEIAEYRGMIGYMPSSNNCVVVAATRIFYI